MSMITSLQATSSQLQWSSAAAAKAVDCLTCRRCVVPMLHVDIVQVLDKKVSQGASLGQAGEGTFFHLLQSFHGTMPVLAAYFCPHVRGSYAPVLAC